MHYIVRQRVLLSLETLEMKRKKGGELIFEKVERGSGPSGRRRRHMESATS